MVEFHKCLCELSYSLSRDGCSAEGQHGIPDMHSAVLWMGCESQEVHPGPDKRLEYLRLILD